MALFNAFMLTIIKILIVVVFAGTGIFLGKKLRDSKDEKNNEN